MKKVKLVLIVALLTFVAAGISNADGFTGKKSGLPVPANNGWNFSTGRGLV